jgi:hypothetical protein
MLKSNAEQAVVSSEDSSHTMGFKSLAVAVGSVLLLDTVIAPLADS